MLFSDVMCFLMNKEHRELETVQWNIVGVNLSKHSVKCFSRLWGGGVASQLFDSSIRCSGASSNYSKQRPLGCWGINLGLF